MKSTHELDPELHGLLEEIAADPRSRLRLAPRHALRSWFVSGESVHSRALDATAAERHVVAAHREALAALYCEASRLAYWKRPGLAHLPRTGSGRPRDLDAHEAMLRDSLQVRRQRQGNSDLAMLLASLDGSTWPRDGAAFARAALLLVPRSSARLALASHLLEEGVEGVADLFSHVAEHSFSEMERALARASLGAMQFELGHLDKAQEWYRSARSCWHEANLSLMNLALLAARDEDAVVAAECLAASVLQRSGAVVESHALLQRWCSAHPSFSRQLHQRFLRIESRVPEAVQTLASAYDLSSS